MATVVKMPKMGVNMEEGQIVSWIVEEGGKVEKGVPLFEMETDKTTMEVDATVDGYLLKILVETGEEYECGTDIAIIGEKDEDISDIIG